MVADLYVAVLYKAFDLLCQKPHRSAARLFFLGASSHGCPSNGDRGYSCFAAWYESLMRVVRRKASYNLHSIC